jgi:hypothetical protein
MKKVITLKITYYFLKLHQISLKLPILIQNPSKTSRKCLKIKIIPQNPKNPQKSPNPQIQLKQFSKTTKKSLHPKIL